MYVTVGIDMNNDNQTFCTTSLDLLSFNLLIKKIRMKCNDSTTVMFIQYHSTDII